MDIGKCFECLIGIEFDQYHGNYLLVFVVMLQNSEYRFWNIVHYYVQIDFIRFVTLSIESMFKSNYIRVEKFLHDL
jgi:hypothetical protein